LPRSPRGRCTAPPVIVLGPSPRCSRPNGGGDLWPRRPQTLMAGEPRRPRPPAAEGSYGGREP
jgi:hypothetical protein